MNLQEKLQLLRKQNGYSQEQLADKIGIVESKVTVKDYLTKSTLPASDYVINPYVGCPHACKYCYACFMKRFTKHNEKWGCFIDIKECSKPINIQKLQGKSVFISSVTDCYNRFEEKYMTTRKILEQLINADCQITISTKSSLILRDLDLLKKLPNLKAAFSINTLDEAFRKDMDSADTIQERLSAMAQLYDSGIYTVLFMSPIFPYITDCKGIIDVSRNITCEYWFENLNLRGSYKKEILDYISVNYPELAPKYAQIYLRKDNTYWNKLAAYLDDYCSKIDVKYTNYFFHESIKT